ncbi:MAG TPA: hypothetical protein VM369_11000 [Candidatus Binatia bacterium]|nr:hypothetical protein [Candidatus Binatia bacterium]
MRRITATTLALLAAGCIGPRSYHEPAADEAGATLVLASDLGGVPTGALHLDGEHCTDLHRAELLGMFHAGGAEAPSLRVAAGRPFRLGMGASSSSAGGAGGLTVTNRVSCMGAVEFTPQPGGKYLAVYRDDGYFACTITVYSEKDGAASPEPIIPLRECRIDNWP